MEQENLRPVGLLLCICITFSMPGRALPAQAASLQSVLAGNEQVYEAEDADYYGELWQDASCSGGQYVKITTPGTYCCFTIEVSEAGYYNLSITSAGEQSEKWDYIYVDDVMTAYLCSPNNQFSSQVIEKMYMSAGQHTVKIEPMYGWTMIDCLTVAAAGNVDIFSPNTTLSNPNASDSANELMAFIAANYGQNIISGQQCEEGYYGDNIRRIRDFTGKTPAIIGMDLMNYTPAWAARGEVGHTIDYALEFAGLGGIVTLSWHWSAPDQYLIDESRWHEAYRTPYVNIDLSAVMNGEDPEGCRLLLADIDAIAEQLKRLSDADVPVLFRPLHEASGTWFWWGSDGPEAYIALWKTMYERLTAEHGLNNLIWVWNGQSKDWYPGDEFVDIVGEDIYTQAKDYSVHTSKFMEVVSYPDSTKIVALTENGTLFDVDKALETQTMWSWFCTWAGDHALIGGENAYTEPEMWIKVYSHENVITLQDLPWSENGTEENPAFDLNVQIADYQHILLQWKPVENAASYTIIRSSTAEDKAQIAYLDAASQSFEDSVLCGRMYTYQVIASTTDGSISVSAQAGGQTKPETPDIVAIEDAPYHGHNRHLISFSASGGADGYIIYGDTYEFGSFPEVAQVTSESQELYGINEIVYENITYYYKMCAYVVADGEYVCSLMSSQKTGLSADTVKPVITNAVSDNSGIYLQWDPPAGNGDAPIYQVFRQSGGEAKQVIAFLEQPSCMDTDVAAGITYQYSIQAFWISGDTAEYSYVSDPVTVLFGGRSS